MAAEVARALSGDLLIVTVADSLAFEEAQQVARTEGSTGDVLEAMTTRTLKAAEARARHLGVSQIELRVGWGDVTRSFPALTSFVTLTRARELFLNSQCRR